MKDLSEYVSVEQCCEIYMQLYNERSNLYWEYDPCKAIDELNEKITCIRNRIAEIASRKARYRHNNSSLLVVQIDSTIFDVNDGMALAELCCRYLKINKQSNNGKNDLCFTDPQTQIICIRITEIIMRANGYILDASEHYYYLLPDDEHM